MPLGHSCPAEALGPAVLGLTRPGALGQQLFLMTIHQPQPGQHMGLCPLPKLQGGFGSGEGGGSGKGSQGLGGAASSRMSGGGYLSREDDSCALSSTVGEDGGWGAGTAESQPELVELGLRP